MEVTRSNLESISIIYDCLSFISTGNMKHVVPPHERDSCSTSKGHAAKAWAPSEFHSLWILSLHVKIEPGSRGREKKQDKKNTIMTMMLWKCWVPAFDLGCLSQQHKSHLGRSVEPSVLGCKFGPFCYVHCQPELFLQTSTYGLVCVFLWCRLRRFRENKY